MLAIPPSSPIARRTGAALIAVIAFLLLLEVEYNLLPIFDLPTILQADRDLVASILVTVVALAIISIVLSVIGTVFERVQSARIGSHARARSTWRVIRYSVWFVVLAGIGIAFAGNVGAAALGLGLVGAGLAFVLQRPLLNVAAWATITYQQLYRIGDRVAMGDVRGYVTDIRLMHSELREMGAWMAGDTFTGRIVSVPNAQIFDVPVVNYTKDIPFVWDEVENLVTYESDVDLAKRYMLEAAREVVGDFMQVGYQRYLARLEVRDLEGLMLREPEIRMIFADSGVKMYVLFFCSVEGRRRTKSQITERMWRKFKADPRVEIAYPHLKLVRPEAGEGDIPEGLT